eukprot:Protomagalhaensia_sp_Gyna_25__4789@NODE_483_length_3300_cov_10_467648_g375_i0_p2_GENE_NODE_483_length_3300_cov_10_467648_g375_i0NODE_483_length_3300_cov_10_467648_g375_i0_p2_ORF_typecomplete_len270_score43_26PseudoU_synth_1/PF01416_20/13PseudoU_synth_1/PF01416_20/2_1_NODE_483_length_3300_cov_10_467648_g375_i09401749
MPAHRHIRGTVWKPKGLFPNFNSLETRIDYRQAWDIGYVGTRVVRRRELGHPVEYIHNQAGGGFWDAEFDGTDTERFFKMRPVFNREQRRHRVLNKLERVMGLRGQHAEPLIIPAQSFMTAEYHRLVGTIRIHDLREVSPQRKSSQTTTAHRTIQERVTCITLDLVRGSFMDALIYCLWQMQIQLEIRKIRLQRIMNVIALRQQSFDKRRDESRARAAVYAEEQTGDRDSAPLLFDPVPTRARLSKALAAPTVIRPSVTKPKQLAPPPL